MLLQLNKYFISYSNNYLHRRDFKAEIIKYVSIFQKPRE